MKEMLVNVSAGHERRLAIVNNSVLEELYIERESEDSHVGNIYKGRVTNIEPSIQAAFIDFGGARNGFLHISDVQAQFFPRDKRVEEPVGRKASRKDRPPIQDCLRRGQELVVQVIKSGIGTKGPTLTTYLSIPGRFLVMMPGMTRFGVSRKIEDEDNRGELRGLIEQLETPDGLGFIVRTAGLGRSKRDLQQDLKYLTRLWRSIDGRIRKNRAPAELFQESDLVIRTIRDVYSNEIDRIVCDDPETASRITEFLRVAMPRTPNKVMLYNGTVPLFDRHGLEDEIERIYSRRVEMPGGASLVIDQAEALVAIDVNSGKNRSNDDAEETAYRINLQAAKEVARQLRLRDLGGVIVIDFIDMRYERHQRDVERVLRDHIKRDRAKTKLLKLSRFGLIEMTRQRMRPSLKRSLFTECTACKGQGLIKSDESLGLSVLRNLQLACNDSRIANITLKVPPRVANYLSNRRRAQVVELEQSFGKKIIIISDDELASDDVIVECRDERDGLINWLPDPQSRNPMPSAPANAPINLIRKPPTESELVNITEYDGEAAAAEPDDEDEAPEARTDEETPAEAPEGERTSRRKRRRRGRKGRDSDRQEQQAEPADRESDAADQETVEQSGADEQSDDSSEPAPGESDAQTENGEAVSGDQPRSKRRRRRGGRRRRSKNGANGESREAAEESGEQSAEGADVDTQTPAPRETETQGEGEPTRDTRDTRDSRHQDDQQEQEPRRSRRSRRRRSSAKRSQEQTDQEQAAQDASAPATPATPAAPAAEKSQPAASEAAEDRAKPAPIDKAAPAVKAEPSASEPAASPRPQPTGENAIVAARLDETKPAQPAVKTAAPADPTQRDAEPAKATPAAKDAETPGEVKAAETADAPVTEAKSAKKKTKSAKKAKAAKTAKTAKKAKTTRKKTTRKKAAAKSDEPSANQSADEDAATKPAAKTVKKKRKTRKKAKATDEPTPTDDTSAASE